MALPADSLIPAPPDPIFGLNDLFAVDHRPRKVNLAVGVYVDDRGITPVLESVAEAERLLVEARTTKTYHPIEGSARYRSVAAGLVLGRAGELIESGRAAVVQTPGGTGALRVAADFIRQTGGGSTIWISDPTWPNHLQIFSLAGFQVARYPYLDGSGQRIDASRLLETLGTAQRGDLVLLQASSHNPSGIDPSADLWREIADVLADRELLPIVDFAYQGLGDGLQEDAGWLDAFARSGVEFLVCSSFSKNFALYCERVGALTVVATDRERADAALGHVKIAIRANYSNPPAHGADIVQLILGDPSLRSLWERELAGMRERIRANRRALVEALESRGAGDWGTVRGQRGLFALLGLDPSQVTRLRCDWGVYTVLGGRINLAGLTSENVAWVADAVSAVLSGATGDPPPVMATRA